MRVGCPKEIKNHEYRVGLTPGAVREYIAHGHEVIVQSGAGIGIGADDGAYQAAGAKVVKTAEEVFQQADMIVKVKEPQPSEWAQLREGQLLYTYLHLAPDPEQTKGLLASGVTAIAYETAAACRCLRRCPKLPGGWLYRLARRRFKKPMAAAAFYLVASPVCYQAK